MYVAVLNITQTKDIGHEIDVVNLIPPSVGCLHDYQLTPRDMKTLAHADVLVINGAGMESFIESVAKELKNLCIIDASKGLELIESEEACCHEHHHASKNSAHSHSAHSHSHSRTKHNHSVDSHTWMSISNMMHQVRHIADELGKMDPKNQSIYQKNADLYISQLEKARASMQKTIQGARHRNIVTSHPGFAYFAKEFELNIVAVVQPHPDSEPSAKELAKTIQTVKKLGANVALFSDDNSNDKSIETVGRETGKKVYLLHSMVRENKPADGFNDYIYNMESNRVELEEALK